MSDVLRPSILLIDSGVGGLSICQSILAEDDRIKLIYFADDAFFPYGLMNEDDLSARLHVIVSDMLRLHQPDLVVLACNTVSTLVLPALRDKFDIPFVGVVPAIKPAALLSKTKRIGLVATPATVKRTYTDQLINDYASDCDVFRVGSNALVLQAENLIAGKDVNHGEILRVLKPFIDEQGHFTVDVVVLGCTHFPLLRGMLEKISGNVAWIDSGEAVAKRVMFLISEQLSALASSSESYSSPVHELYFSASLPDAEKFSTALRSLNILQHKLHRIPVKRFQ